MSWPQIKNGQMLHTQHGIQRHDVGGVGHFPINNGQEKNTINPWCSGLHKKLPPIGMVLMIQCTHWIHKGTNT